MSLSNVNLKVGQTVTVKAQLTTANGVQYTGANKLGVNALNLSIPDTSNVSVSYAITANNPTDEDDDNVISIQTQDTFTVNGLLEAKQGSQWNGSRDFADQLSLKIQALNPGQATVTATSTSSATASFTITVSPNSPDQITFNLE